MASGLMNPFFLVEREILKNTNARGDLSKLSKPGDLEKIVSYLARLKKSVNNEKCLIVTGFPCVEATLVNAIGVTEKRNIQETDGIAGAVAIARALGPDKCILGIEGDIKSAEFGVKYSAAHILKHVLENIGEKTREYLPSQTTQRDDSSFKILTLPTQRRIFGKNDPHPYILEDFLSTLRPYSILAIEKAGYSAPFPPNAVGEGVSKRQTINCGPAYTMKGRDISSDCVPAGIMKALWDNASLRMAIGDGGNELGLGLVNDLTKDHIPLGDKIACSPEFSADHLLMAGVSNWGGYAIGIGLLSKDLEGTNDVYANKDMISEKSEKNISDTLRELGVCDGVSGKCENATTDGISLDNHVALLNRIYEILKV